MFNKDRSMENILFSRHILKKNNMLQTRGKKKTTGIMLDA